MPNERFPAAYQGEKVSYLNFCSSFLAKAKGPEHKVSVGKNYSGSSTDVSGRGGLCCTEGVSRQGHSGDNWQPSEVSVTVTEPPGCPV